MKYLLCITIGPIQKNIQISRKLLDLYNSSKIVSDIMKTYNKLLVNKNADIIYPITNKLDTDVTNLIICEFECQNNLKSEIENLEVEVLKEIIKKSNVIKDVCSKGNTSIKDILKERYFTFWTADPLGENKNNYFITYRKLIKKLRGIKNTYEFDNTVKYNNSQKKCKLCGERNSLKNEDLCQVCYIIRNYSNKNGFKSLCDISISEWQIKNNIKSKKEYENLDYLFNNLGKYFNVDRLDKIIKELNNYINNNPKKYINSTLLENLNEDLKINKYKINKSTSLENIKKLKNKLTNIDKKLNDLYEKIEKPHYKFCFIKIDVDDFGKWISGEFNKNNANLKQNQRFISEKLCIFASKLKKVFNNTNVKVIYSGGDDFLAVLPIELLLFSLKHIDEIFKENVKNELNKTKNFKKSITYSVSVSIANSKENMSYVLQENREKLDEVKNRFLKSEPFKSGLVINYIISPNKTINAYMKKYTFETYVNNLKFLKTLNKDNYPFTYINAIEQEFRNLKFTDLSDDDKEYLNKMIISEFKRYLNKIEITDKNSKINNYINLHTSLFEDILSENYFDQNGEYLDFTNIINCLKIYANLSKYNYVEVGEKIETT